MDCLSEFVTVHGVKLHVRRLRSDGPTMLMIHGLTDNGACWGRVAEQFTPEYDVLLVDVRGHGLSDAPPSGYATSTIAGDLIGTLEILGTGPATLLGHSMGADAAAEVARLRPDLVRTLVLEDPPWNDQWTLSQASEREKMRQDWLTSLEELKRHTYDEILALGRKDLAHWVDEELVPWAQSKVEVGIQALDYVVAERPAWQLTVRSLRCPTLLVMGETARGALVSEAMGEEARGIFPELEVLHIAGAGHCVHRDRFEEYLRSVRRFLDES